MRSFDLLCFSGIVYLVTSWFSAVGLHRRHRLWLALALFLMYFTFSEWNHCQRDTWMLLPAMCALHLRRRQMERLTQPNASIKAIVLSGLLEGLCWAGTVWIKPHVVFPAAACWLLSVFLVRKGRRLAIDLAALVVAGLAVGAAGLGWLYFSGTWPYFLEQQIEWNPRYFQAGKEHWTGLRFLAMLIRNAPWHFLQPLAIALAVATLVSALRARRLNNSSAAETSDSNAPIPTPVTTWNRCLLGVFYLTWLSQVFLLQHLFDYVYTPTAVLAVTVLAMEILLRSWTAWRPWVYVFALIAIYYCPV
jgi:hypothetical protein